MNFKLRVHDFIHTKKRSSKWMEFNYLFISNSAYNISSTLTLISFHEHIGLCPTQQQRFVCNSRILWVEDSGLSLTSNLCQHPINYQRNCWNWWLSLNSLSHSYMFHTTMWSSRAHGFIHTNTCSSKWKALLCVIYPCIGHIINNPHPVCLVGWRPWAIDSKIVE